MADILVDTEWIARHMGDKAEEFIEWFETIHQLYIYAIRYNGKWGWKIDGDIGYIDYGSVEGGKIENLIEAIKKYIKSKFRFNYRRHYIFYLTI